MPILLVCDNVADHNEDTRFILNGKMHFIISFTMPFANSDEGAVFNYPRPELVSELMIHDPMANVILRHSLCEKCQNEVSLEVASVIRQANAFKL